MELLHKIEADNRVNKLFDVLAVVEPIPSGYLLLLTKSLLLVESFGF